jgi:hypothetical protein
MATAQANQKVFVSPGVYTSETDLSFVAQSVGVTTLGLVGETIKGPAFEPIFITNYDEFQAYFGGTEPVKFVNTQIPKYEAAYIAKSYLQQSNQLFVTRILGLSGYDAGPSWSISITANVDPTTIGEPSNKTLFTATFTGTQLTDVIEFTSNTFPIEILANLNVQYTQLDGSTSTLQDDFNGYLGAVINQPLTSGDTAVIYGSIPQTDYVQVSSDYFIESQYGCENNFTNNDLTAESNDAWYYANFDFNNNDSTTGQYSGYSFYYVISELTSDLSGNFTGTISGYSYTFSGTPYSEFNNMVVATIRSRGISLYENSTTSVNHGPVYQVGIDYTNTNYNSNWKPNNLQLICTGQYSGIKKSPFSTFLLSGVTKDNESFSFETSMLASSSKYITKVLGADNFGKSRFEVPIYVEESYQGSLNYGYNQGYVRGLNCNLIALPSARSQRTDSIAYNVERYQSPETPYLVSELRGNKVYKLFKFISISDGDSANTEIKVSIANLSFNNMSFDVLVRNFFDTDANPIVIEKFTNCNMDPASNNFIGKKIGSSNGEFALISKYVMVEMADEAPIDALPCGFYGYTQREYLNYDEYPSPYPKFKTKYYFPGEVIANPPFGTNAGGAPVESAGDIVRRSYLGFSSQFGIDESFLTYKGKQTPSNWVESVNQVDGQPWNVISKGFHMDSGATVVTISNTNGQTAFECGVAEFRNDPNPDNPYYFIFSRKYTVCFAGGFDGWDIYREFRTNEDRFRLGDRGFLAGASASPRYPNATGDGLFKRITVQDNNQDFANTDYYAYLLGILTFSNPESTNINIFATSSIDYVNNSNLVEEAIDMVQFSRADSVYIATTPDYPMYNPDSTNPQLIIYPQEAVDNLDNKGIDSNYTATYYPWILTRDTVNNTQIYLPPTGEVCRNLALTDNISFPWFASAGYTRGLVNSIKARIKLTQTDRDTLYQGRINPIATFSDVGTVIWGNKTLQVADTALNRLNVRRLLLQARKLISAVAVRLLFEQNDQIVRQQFLDSVNPILDSIRRDRGLYDFRVTVSSTPEDLDANRLVGKIYLKPTKALEFIDIEFFITPTGASFENI